MTPPRPLSRRRALRGAASLVGALAVGLSARPVPAITAALDLVSGKPVPLQVPGNRTGGVEYLICNARMFIYPQYFTLKLLT